jgi:hypothetical protein
MRFKPRPPLTASQDRDQKIPEEQQKTETLAVAETQSDGASDADPLSGAFDAVARVVREEMKSIHQDMISRIETLRESQQKALSEFTERTNGSIAMLRDQLESAKAHANSHSEEVKVGLERILADQERKLETEISTLSGSISGVRQDLDRQIATSGQVSTVLNNMASVFSEPQKLPSRPQDSSK